MDIDKRTVAAICTAVREYIQAEKAVEKASQARTVRPATNIWSQSGRQEIMRNRQMWQLRIVSG
jgi:seryl-tRNA(Sec) selenium transferase